MSYAPPSNIELFRGAATYVDRIIKGARSRANCEDPRAHDSAVTRVRAERVIE